MKILIRIVFIAFGAVFAFLVYYLNYNTGISNNTRDQIISAAQKANEENDPEILMKTMCMYEIPYEKTSYIDATADYKDPQITSEKKVQISVFGTVNQVIFYQEDNQDKAFAYADWCYYMLVRNITTIGFKNVPVQGETDKYENQTSIKFNFAGGYEAYDYKLNYTKTVNTDDKVTTTPADNYISALYGSRTYATSYSDSSLGQAAFMLIPIPQSLIDGMKKERAGENVDYNTIDIVSFNLYDNQGNKLFNQDQAFEFDFSEQFFNNTDLVKFKDSYKLYADYRNGLDKSITQEQYDEAVKYLNEFKITNVDPNATTFSAGHSKDVVYTTGLIWQSIGITAIFVLVMVIVYFLIFKFKWIKSLVFRDRSGKNRYVPNVPKGAGSGAGNKKDSESYRQGNQTRKNNNYQAKRNSKVAVLPVADDTKELEIKDLTEEDEKELFGNKEVKEEAKPVAEEAKEEAPVTPETTTEKAPEAQPEVETPTEETKVEAPEAEAKDVESNQE